MHESELSKMKRLLRLDDLALFLAVADAGGLAGAARRTGASLPTLSRRMAELERRTGRHLFERGRHGYRLTAEGRGLLQEAAGLREIAARLERWQAAGAARPRVRITAGTWTTRFLARALREIWSDDADWVPEFLASNAVVDLARREADIGIRSRRPEQPWLAGRRTGEIEYAVYAVDVGVQGYVALSEEVPSTPSNHWLRRMHPDRISTTASNGLVALELALAGLGRIVMPCFAGRREPGLVQLDGPIAELTHAEWLVAHHDARHDPPVRRALDRVHRLLTTPGR